MRTSARIVQLPTFSDARGMLSVGELGAALPFEPKRFFLVCDVPATAVRGAHAHKHCHQFVIVPRGSCRLTLIDTNGRDDIMLSSPAVGVHIPPMVWGEQSDFAPDTVVLVLASDRYDAGDYIRSLDELGVGGAR